MRKVHVNNIEYKYSVGSQHIVIQLPTGKKICVGCAEVKGISNYDFERGGYKKTSDGMVLPSEVKKYIEEENKHGRI